jgi:hypothetical protein
VESWRDILDKIPDNLDNPLQTHIQHTPHHIEARQSPSPSRSYVGAEARAQRRRQLETPRLLMRHPPSGRGNIRRSLLIQAIGAVPALSQDCPRGTDVTRRGAIPIETRTALSGPLLKRRPWRNILVVCVSACITGVAVYLIYKQSAGLDLGSAWNGPF